MQPVQLLQEEEVLRQRLQQLLRPGSFVLRSGPDVRCSGRADVRGSFVRRSGVVLQLVT